MGEECHGCGGIFFMKGPGGLESLLHPAALAAPAMIIFLWRQFCYTISIFRGIANNINTPGIVGRGGGVKVL